MGTLKMPESAPPSGNLETSAAQETGHVVQSVAVEEKHLEITPDEKDDKHVKEPDNEAKKKKPEATLGNYFVSSCRYRMLQLLINQACLHLRHQIGRIPSTAFMPNVYWLRSGAAAHDCRPR